MNLEELQESIVLVNSKDKKVNAFGTGFILQKSNGFSYVITCAHVVESIGSLENIKVNDISAEVIAFGDPQGLDLAVLKVRGLLERPELSIYDSVNINDKFFTAGFQIYDKNHLIRILEGRLENPVVLQSFGMNERVKAWDVLITDEKSLQTGNSGSPVVCEKSGSVIGVLSYREGKKRGLAISIKALGNLWKFVDSESLYHSLVKLGYSKQIHLFRTMINKYSIAALLIYGPPGYGQRWLLNLLLVKHLPYLMESRKINIKLNRSVRRNDAQAIWRELCRYLEIDIKSSRDAIVNAIYQCCKTQNIILVFHNVEWLPKISLKELIQEFWMPLAEKLNTYFDKNCVFNRVLMFLVDYDGKVGSLEEFFDNKMNSFGEKFKPIKSPEISDFTEIDISAWIRNELEILPKDFINEIDAAVIKIIEDSNGGIPELTLDEICAKCGHNWYEESEKWLKY